MGQKGVQNTPNRVQFTSGREAGSIVTPPRGSAKPTSFAILPVAHRS